MKNKKLLFLAIFLLFSNICFSQIKFGFGNKNEIIFFEQNEYIPDLSKENSLYTFLGYKTFFSNCFIDFSVIANLENSEKLKFNLYNINFSYFLDNFTFFIKKDKFLSLNGNYIKNGIPFIKDFYDYNEEKYYYSGINFNLLNFKITLQEIFDTKNIEDYNLPKWYTTNLSLSYELPNFQFSNLSDFRYEKNKFDLKNSTNVSYNFLKTFDFYANYDFIKENNKFSNNFNEGISYTYIKNSFNVSLSFEHAFLNKENYLIYFIHSDFLSFFQLNVGCVNNIKDKENLKFLSEFKINIKEVSFNIKFIHENILKNNDSKKYLTIGAEYEI